MHISVIDNPIDLAWHRVYRMNLILLSCVKFNLNIVIIFYIIYIERIYRNLMDFAYINCTNFGFQDSRIEKIISYKIHF